ncbi:hypothetical protein IP88_15830 [alpha proteobacterium AAP81b]|nr:hypothetical protein IP88_15830 [alpha proteobacterium AAP81b]
MGNFGPALLTKDSAFVAALGGLAAGWPKLSAINDGRSLADFLRVSRAKFQSPAFANAVPGDLREAYDAVADVLDRIWNVADAFEKSPVAPLLDRLDRFVTPGSDPDRGLIRWPLLDGSASGSAGDFALAIDGHLGIAFDADDRWPDDADRAKDPGLDLLLSIQAEGAVNASAKAKWPFPGGSVGLGASATLAPSLAMYFAPQDRSQLYGVALAKCLTQLPAPFDLGAIWRAAQTSDFKGLRFDLEGAVSLDAELAVAGVGDFGGIKIGATAAVNAKVSRHTQLQLAIRALPMAGGIRPLALRIERVGGATSQLGVDFGVSIDPTALTARVTGAVVSALDWQDKQLAKLKPFLTPGTLLRETIKAQLSAVIGDPGLRDALLADLAAGRADGASGITDWLTGLVTDAFDVEAGKVGDKVTTAAEDAVAAVLARLGGGLADTLRADADKHIETAVAKVVGEVRTKLESVLKGVLAETVTPLDKLLGKIGVKVAEVENDLDKAFEAVRDLLAAYEALVAKFRAKVDEVAKAKLQAEFTWSESRESSTEALIAGVINGDSAETKALFKTLLKGDFGAVERLLRGGVVPGFDLDKENSWLLRKQRWQQNSAFRLTILGFDASVSSALSASTEVRLTGSGDIVASSVSEVISRRNAFGVAQTAGIRSAFRLMQARDAAGASRAAQLGVRIDRRYDDLNAGGLGKFLAGLRDLKLISADAATGAGALVTRLAPAPGAKLPCELTLQLLADDAGMARLLDFGRRLNRSEERDAARRQLYEASVAAITTAKSLTTDEFSRARAEALRQVRAGFRDGLPSVPSDFDILVRLPLQNDFAPTPPGQDDPRVARPYQFLLAYAGGRLPDTTLVKGGIPGLIDMLDALADLFAAPVPADTAGVEALLRTHSKRIAAGLLPWVEDMVLLRDWKTLAPKLRTFLVLLAGLLDPDWSKEAGRPPLLVTITPLSGNVAPVVFA